MNKTQVRYGLVALVLSLALLFQFASVQAVGSIVDLSTGDQNVVVRGEFQNSTLGEVTALGDFNNDGFDDLLIGAAAASHGGRGNSGAVYMIIGGASPSASYNLASPSTQARFTVYGAQEGDIFGHSVAVGDINGDNIDDMVIGADRVAAGGTLRGAVYVFFGSSDYYSSNRTVDLASGSAHLTIYGTVDNARLGRAVAIGDVNGDGRGDIIIGAYTQAPSEAGAVYVVSGSTSWNANTTATPINLNESNAMLTIKGAPDAAAKLFTMAEAEKAASPVFADEVFSPLAGIGPRLGRSVDAADVNNDGMDDIIAGAYGSDVNGNADAGKTYIIFGKAFSTGTTIDLGATAADVTINGIDPNDQSGFYVAGGDLTGDGFEDVAIGAYLANGETGEVYVMSGAGLSGVKNLATDAFLTVYGAAAGDRLGRSVAAVDVNRNGLADLLIGASRATPDGRNRAGKAYIIKDISSGTLNLTDTSAYDLVIYGASTGGADCLINDDEGTITGNCPDELGRAISAGDFNGDGVNDIIVGALFANNETLLNAGAVYVIYSPGNMVYLPILSRQ